MYVCLFPGVLIKAMGVDVCIEAMGEDVCTSIPKGVKAMCSSRGCGGRTRWGASRPPPKRGGALQHQRVLKVLRLKAIGGGGGRTLWGPAAGCRAPRGRRPPGARASCARAWSRCASPPAPPPAHLTRRRAAPPPSLPPLPPLLPPPRPPRAASRRPRVRPPCRRKAWRCPREAGARGRPRR